MTDLKKSITSIDIDDNNEFKEEVMEKRISNSDERRNEIDGMVRRLSTILTTDNLVDDPKECETLLIRSSSLKKIPQTTKESNK